MPEEERDARAQGLVERFAMGQTVNVYATMARHPDVIERCIPLGQQLRSGRLSLRERELLILRTGWRCSCDYEYAQHSRLALGGGMTIEDLHRILDGPEAPGWEPHEAALLRAADELHDHACIGADTWAALATRYDAEQLIEVPMVVGYYHLIAFFLNSLGVPLEAGAQGFPARSDSDDPTRSA
ncbi:MAG: carboxymuconolactone decarboxylase family protein [Acidimicrobiia bacterium]